MSLDHISLYVWTILKFQVIPEISFIDGCFLNQD